MSTTYAVQLWARNVQIRVELDPTPWPRKRAGDMAREALQSLEKGIAAAIEAAPHVGIERSLVSSSAIMVSGVQAEPEKPQAPVVGEPTWESMEPKVLAVRLPEGVMFVTNDQDALSHRIPNSARSCMVFLSEVPPEDYDPEEHPLEVGSIELDFDLEADEVESKVMAAAKAILESVQLRGTAETPQGG